MKKLWMLSGMAAGVVMIATGCTSINTNDAASDSKQAMVPAVYEPVIRHVDQKVSGSAQMHVVLTFIKWGDNAFADRTVLGGMSSDSTFFSAFSGLFPNPIRDAKAAAVYNACKAAKCDMLLSAKYELTTTDYFVYKVVNCTVTGFPGTEVGVVRKDVAFPSKFNGSMTVPVLPLN